MCMHIHLVDALEFVLQSPITILEVCFIGGDIYDHLQTGEDIREWHLLNWL